MKVSMKQFEVWCGEYSERWNDKNKWDFYCLVKDAWINGFKKAREEAEYETNTNDDFLNIELGECTVDVEIPSPQTGINKSFNIQQFKRDFANFYNCDNINVVIDERGLVSFQGTFKT